MSAIQESRKRELISRRRSDGNGARFTAAREAVRYSLRRRDLHALHVKVIWNLRLRARRAPLSSPSSPPSPEEKSTIPNNMPDWEETVKTTRAQLQAKIDKIGPKVEVEESVKNVATLTLDGLLEADEIEVTEQDVDTLLSKLASAEWSAEKVIVSS